MLEGEGLLEVGGVEFYVSVHGRCDDVLGLLHLADVSDEGLVLLEGADGGEVQPRPGAIAR